MRYVGGFDSKEDICREFRIENFDGVVLFADYRNEDYEGSAHVLFLNGSKLYYVNGGHCSCHGLEDQWEPDEITVDQILHMAANGNGWWNENSWIADALRKIRDQELAQDPDEVLVMLRLLAPSR
jgi:hypothetical protein